VSGYRAVEERISTVNGFWINFCIPSGVYVVVWIKTGAEVGYKLTRRAAEDFAMGCKGDGYGKTWEKYRMWD